MQKGGEILKKAYVPKRMLTVQLPLDLFDKLEEIARRKNQTKTSVLVSLLEGFEFEEDRSCNSEGK